MLVYFPLYLLGCIPNCFLNNELKYFVLKLNCDKALAYLDWHSTLHYETCVRFIADWYKAFYIEYGKDMYALTVSQIEEYVQAARKQKLKWAE